ncbi:Na+ H+ antiporter [Tubulinosema ratisbonensis]|uniref:Na+ H+ antiporter n=1 Tax=Tubulinosema ratisbonensis TaxID=291195 RepID=A0A437APN6_9MICR|nr:Na+ H+ antiporter [Tubulinosema ratisbonensis]
MIALYKILAIIGSFNIGFGLISLFIKEKCYLSETLIATIVGILIGKHVFNLVDLKNEISNNFMYEFSRMVITLQVVAVGAHVPKEYFKRAFKSIFVLLGPLMLISWVVSSLIIKFVSGFSYTLSFLAGACVTPTDPVLASGILKGKFANRYIPVHLRKLLAFESGANDGLGLPLLAIAIYNLVFKDNSTEIYSNWIYTTWLYEIGLSIVLGVGIGMGCKILLCQSKKHHLIDKDSYLAYILALSFFVSGVTAMMKIDDIFACFISGIAFAWCKEEILEEVKESQVMEILDMICSLSFFIFFGNVFSWSSFSIKNVAIAIFILLFRRLPFVVLFKKFIPQLYNDKEVFFAGWYGPIGVGAIFLAEHAKHELAHSKAGLIILDNEVVDLIHIIVLFSVILHGITAPVVHFHLRRSTKKDPKELYELSEYSETEGNTHKKQGKENNSDDDI